MENGLTDDALLVKMVQQFEESEEASREARDLARRCRDYYDGNQLTAKERAELQKRKQPPIVINRVRRKIDWLRGLEMQSRTDPKAFPRTPKHEQGAQAATDAIRFVCDQQDVDRKRSAAWDSMLVEGVGAIEVVHRFQPPMDQPEIVVNRYAYDRCFADPHSREPDFSDARYLGVVIWQDAESLKEQYPDGAEVIDASVAEGAGLDDKLDDIPAHKRWADRERRRVRLVLMHYLDKGVWKWATYVKRGVLDSGESPYLDEHGASVCPLLMQSAYIDGDGNRYGAVKDMLDPQDEINKRRSKLLHQLNSRQTVGVKGGMSAAAIKRELADPAGHIELDADMIEAAQAIGMSRPFEILPNQDQIAGQAQLLQEAKSEIDLMGANSGLQGKDEGAQSGRAIMAKQQGGLIEIAPLTDGLSDFTRRIYRHIWMRIRQFWRAETWIRVTDDERNIRFVGLNQPVTLRDRLSQMPEEQIARAAQQMGLVPGDPRLEAVVAIDNEVEDMDVDILIEEVPDTVTLESETFQQLVQMASSMPGSVPPDVMIELAPGLKRDVKDKLLEGLKQQGQQQQQQQAQAAAAQGQMAQIEAAKKQAETEKTLSLANKTSVEAQRLALGY